MTKPRTKTGPGKKRTTARRKTVTDRKAKAVEPRLEQRKVITPEERHRKIAEVAYVKAKSRGFQGGSPERDWYEAAAEIDAMLTPLHGSRPK